MTVSFLDSFMLLEDKQVGKGGSSVRVGGEWKLFTRLDVENGVEFRFLKCLFCLCQSPLLIGRCGLDFNCAVACGL